jgi:hypothetical protein
LAKPSKSLKPLKPLKSLNDLNDFNGFNDSIQRSERACWIFTGGTIVAHSRINEGTAFLIELPIAGKEEAE